MKTYSSKSNARRAAIKELGQYAAPGLDYNLVQQGKGKWTWEPKASNGEVAEVTRVDKLDSLDSPHFLLYISC